MHRLSKNYAILEQASDLRLAMQMIIREETEITCNEWRDKYGALYPTRTEAYIRDYVNDMASLQLEEATEDAAEVYAHEYQRIKARLGIEGCYSRLAQLQIQDRLHTIQAYRLLLLKKVLLDEYNDLMLSCEEGDEEGFTYTSIKDF